MGREAKKTKQYGQKEEGIRCTKEVSIASLSGFFGTKCFDWYTEKIDIEQLAIAGSIVIIFSLAILLEANP